MVVWPWARDEKFHLSRVWLIVSNVETSLKINYTAGWNMTILSFACVLAPFFFVLWNGTLEGYILNCSSRICKLSNCWDGSDGALIVWVPAVIPLPVLMSQEHQEIILNQQLSDFGITTAIVAAIAVAATVVTVTGVAILQMAVMQRLWISCLEGLARPCRHRMLWTVILDLDF